MAQKGIFGFRPKYLYHRNNTAENVVMTQTENATCTCVSTRSVPPAKRLLSKEVETDHGVKTMKSTLLESVSTRFSEIYSDPLHFIATVLDPRYKDHYLRKINKAGRTRKDPGRDGCGEPAWRRRRSGAQRRRRSERRKKDLSLCTR